MAYLVTIKRFDDAGRARGTSLLGGRLVKSGSAQGHRVPVTVHDVVHGAVGIFPCGARDFWVTDADGNQAFCVKAKVLSLRHSLELQDASGRTLASIKHKLLTFTDAMEIEHEAGSHLRGGSCSGRERRVDDLHRSVPRPHPRRGGSRPLSTVELVTPSSVHRRVPSMSRLLPRYWPHG